MRTLPRETAGPAGEADRIGLTVAGLALIMVLPVLDQTIVATALPSIAADLGGLGQIAWVVNAYLLGVGLSAPLYGKLGDSYGRKPLMAIAVVVFVAASALAGASRSMPQLIACRALQGLGGGGLMNLTTAAVADLLPPAERGRAQGYTGAVFAAGSIGGPLLGGVFCGTIGWRWVFYINAPLALAGLAIVLRWFRVPHHRVRQRLDWAGGLLLAGAVTCALLVTDWGGITYPWASPPVVSLIAASAVAAALFAWRETRAASPVLPPGLWGSAVFRVAIPSSFLLGAGLFGTVVFLPQFFQVVQGRSATVSGAPRAPRCSARSCCAGSPRGSPSCCPDTPEAAWPGSSTAASSPGSSRCPAAPAPVSSAPSGSRSASSTCGPSPSRWHCWCSPSRCRPSRSAPGPPWVLSHL